MGLSPSLPQQEQPQQQSHSQLTNNRGINHDSSTNNDNDNEQQRYVSSNNGAGLSTTTAVISSQHHNANAHSLGGFGWIASSSTSSPTDLITNVMTNTTFDDNQSNRYGDDPSWHHHSHHPSVPAPPSLPPQQQLPYHFRRPTTRASPSSYDHVLTDDNTDDATTTIRYDSGNTMTDLRFMMSGGDGSTRRRVMGNYGVGGGRLRVLSGKGGVGGDGRGGGPNIALSLFTREITGYSPQRNHLPSPLQLPYLGGHTLYRTFDSQCGGLSSEVSELRHSLDNGDWISVQTMISRMAPRLMAGQDIGGNDEHPGEGVMGEREGFVLSGGVECLMDVFYCGIVVADGGISPPPRPKLVDARHLPAEIVNATLSGCWNETLALLKELMYSHPQFVHDDGSYYPELVVFLFSLLSHPSCFDGAAGLIEEILSLQSQMYARGSTFYLGSVPRLYSLWGGFSLSQMAQFCRILALLIFEPEDRQLMESATVLKSLELLQLRRDRAARSGNDCVVDMNQAILLNDGKLLKKLLTLLKVMNYAPELARSDAYHVMAHFPWINDTLIMLGLSELEDWDDVERLFELSQPMSEIMSPRRHSDDPAIAAGNNDPSGNNDPYDPNDNCPSRWGQLGPMLESLAEVMFSTQTNHLAHVIQVINAAQHAGVAVLRNNNRPAPEQQQQVRMTPVAPPPPVVFRRLADTPEGNNTNPPPPPPNHFHHHHAPPVVVTPEAPPSHHSHPIHTPQDAANQLQFNALNLTSYQVEVLFVLCTLLNGRRKIDAQYQFAQDGLVSILDGMFFRLSWNFSSRNNPATSNGIHGPGCECNPESALRVQYLRLLHNFCDRDCDNYRERGLLLSKEERDRLERRQRGGRDVVLSSESPPRRGLLSKIINAFIHEPDDSPYKFWLASCAESYLRGSTPPEQLFAAHDTGLLRHLLDGVLSDRLHCAGSLQTAFDLLGELCKGNVEVLELLLEMVEEISGLGGFERLMSVAVRNLVDSNVFVRALLLTVERWETNRGGVRDESWRDSFHGSNEKGYLTHSWWDMTTHPVHLPQQLYDDHCCYDSRNNENNYHQQYNIENNDDADDMFKNTTTTDTTKDLANYVHHVTLATDWFTPFQRTIPSSSPPTHTPNATSNTPLSPSSPTLTQAWIFSPHHHYHHLSSSSTTTTSPYIPSSTSNQHTLSHLSWFLSVNQTRLLRDLLTVVNLRNINHENICCLNTAVVLVLFARRKRTLGTILRELKQWNEEQLSMQRRRRQPTASSWRDDDHRLSPSTATTSHVDDDLIVNFRELLWFWTEYYTHRGRDRLSLEFSSHLSFDEWKCVVEELCRDDGSSDTSLMEDKRQRLRLPKSPYRRAPRMAIMERGWMRGGY